MFVMIASVVFTYGSHNTYNLPGSQLKWDGSKRWFSRPDWELGRICVSSSPTRGYDQMSDHSWQERSWSWHVPDLLLTYGEEWWEEGLFLSTSVLSSKSVHLQVIEKFSTSYNLCLKKYRIYSQQQIDIHLYRCKYEYCVYLNKYHLDFCSPGEIL